ncbi:MAG: phenylalanine--tRNA ligase subunit beta [Elusimicrobia bacterium]|nr:phenylalanine--tRNA ligase subunit beta [Elusimicrobiota bacterium]
MKISFSWLKDHVDVPCGPQELADMLPRLGMDAESVERLGPAFSGVVTGEVLAVDKHPNADRLSVCRVTDGSKTYTVVCGAKNVAAGQKIPLARVGASLPGGKLSAAKIRGIDSEGMICSTKELALGGDASGIMVLDPATPVGQDAQALLGGGDCVLDIEITANRPDLLSHLGLARELATCFGFPLKRREETALQEDGSLQPFPVEMLSTGECPRYVGRLIEGVEVKDSPGWLKARLEAVGLRPINSVVDITNFTLMDAGQPLHAFDADKLEGGRIVVRFARAGEKILALDGREYALAPDILVIADASKPVAIAGIMGGEETAVTAKTRRVFLESANFAPQVVRKGSQKLRLRSDSSYRFERSADVEAADRASRSAADLVAQLCGKSVRVSAPLDVYPGKRPMPPISVTARRINEILGSDFPLAEVEKALEAVSAKVVRDGEVLSVVAPTWRQDLGTPWDLAEEAARILGYDRIPSAIKPCVLKPAREPRSHAAERNVRSRLAAAGFHESYTYDFISDRQAALLEVPEDRWARLSNPLTEDWTVLRPSLMPGLLQSARRNLNAQAESIRLFELGKVYGRDGDALAERAHLAGILVGANACAHWMSARGTADCFAAKAAVAGLLEGIPGLRWTAAWTVREPGREDPFAGENLLLPNSRLFVLSPQGTPLARLGVLHPRLARAWDMDKERPAVFELDLSALAALESPPAVFKPFSPFPSSWRDLSVVVQARVPYAEVDGAVRALGIAELSAVDLVDVYAGSGVPEGHRSLSMRLVFCRPDRTLTDAEVAAAVERILAELKARCGAVLRT